MSSASRFASLSFFLAAVVLVLAPAARAQAGAAGAIHGVVTLEDTGKPVHGVTVTVIQLRLSTLTADDGRYEFRDVPPGAYEIHAHLDRVPDAVQMIEVPPGGAVEVPFRLRMRAPGVQVTVTATGSEETSLRAIQPVTSLTSTEIAERNPQSLGDVLDRELGVAKRSFGPGSNRPVLRGFDGDRVLVLEDGNRIGSLGFQSGDHAEPVDVLSLDRIEVVKGPATLLYGSNAIGGVVNAITGHDSAHRGIRGYVTGLAGSNNDQAGGSGGIEAGTERWLFWGSGSGQRASDYETPVGAIANSNTRGGSGSGGFGYYPGSGHLSLEHTTDRRRYGVPFDPDEEDPEVVFLDPRRQSIRFGGGFRDRPGPLGGGQFSLQYSHYRHAERDAFTEEVHTAFRNRTVNYRGVLEQRRSGPWSGSFGIWGLHRDYSSSGEEALAPPAVQNAFAIFGVEKVDFDRVSLQFGARFEHNGYDPSPLPDRGPDPRSFDGVSASAGVRVQLWQDGAIAANYSHSYRAPSLEELYNRGPHPGNATFEIGDPDLRRERGDGFDLSVRHSARRFRAEANYFYYRMADFIYLAPTGNIEDGLIEADYAQGTSRYTGAEGRLEVGLHRNVWWLSKLDYVNAELKGDGTPLPRIPPLRGSFGVEATYKGLRLHPELAMAGRQDRVFTTETATPGYAVLNLNASYTIARRHAVHTFSLAAFNMGDRLYRNHLSFIKAFAPEIGRGVRFTYSVRFF